MFLVLPNVESLTSTSSPYLFKSFSFLFKMVKKIYVPVVLGGSPEALYSLEVCDLRFYCLS